MSYVWAYTDDVACGRKSSHQISGTLQKSLSFPVHIPYPKPWTSKKSLSFPVHIPYPKPWTSKKSLSFPVHIPYPKPWTSKKSLSFPVHIPYPNPVRAEIPYPDPNPSPKIETFPGALWLWWSAFREAAGSTRFRTNRPRTSRNWHRRLVRESRPFRL